MAKVLGEDSLVAIREWVNGKVEELEEYTTDQIEANIPNLPNQAGTYKLSVTIGASGELEYNWVLDS